MPAAAALLVASALPAPSFFSAMPGPPIEWQIWPGFTEYPAAITAMEARVAAIAAGTAGEAIFLVEHPPLYTAGTSAKPCDLVSTRLPVFETGRGGQFTYHGPGQRVVYALLDLKRRRQDLRAYVSALEGWIIATLAAFNISAHSGGDRVGVWVRRPDKGDGSEDKIAAIGIRVRHWVTFHGISLNVEPDLTHFSGIVPCGIAEQRYGVTSLVDLGIPVTMPEVDAVLKHHVATIFGPVA